MDRTMSRPESLPIGTDAGDQEEGKDTLRVVLLCATSHDDEHPRLRGCDVVIVALLKDPPRADAGAREVRRGRSTGYPWIISHTGRSRPTAKPRG